MTTKNRRSRTLKTTRKRRSRTKRKSIEKIGKRRSKATGERGKRRWATTSWIEEEKSELKQKNKKQLNKKNSNQIERIDTICTTTTNDATTRRKFQKQYKHTPTMYQLEIMLVKEQPNN